MTESRCLGNARTNRQGRIQIYVDEEIYDAVAELQADKDATKMIKYIENLTKHNNDFMASAKKCWNEIRDDILLNDCEVIKKEDKLSPKFCHECKGSGILIEYGVDLKKPCPICKGQGFIKS